MNLTLLKKYETLEISKVSEKDQKTLEQVKKLLNNFEETNEAKNKVGEQILDQVIKLNPDAVKKPQVVAQQVAKVQKVAKAKKVTQAKKPATTSTAKTSGNNIMSVAKEIQKTGESWKDAMERAKTVLKERRGQVAEQKKTELEKLLALVRTKKELIGFSKSDIERDAVREAKPTGARVVTKAGFTSNQHGVDYPNKLGRKYWETRDRHADRLAPNYPKDMPLLASGGGFGSKKYKKGDKITTEFGTYYVDGINQELQDYIDKNKSMGLDSVLTEKKVNIVYSKYFNEDNAVTATLRSWFDDKKQPTEKGVRDAMIWSYDSYMDYQIKAGGGSKSDSEFSSMIRIAIADANGNDKDVAILKKYSTDFKDVLITIKEIQALEEVLETKGAKDRKSKDKLIATINLMFQYEFSGVGRDINGKPLSKEVLNRIFNNAVNDYSKAEINSAIDRKQNAIMSMAKNSYVGDTKEKVEERVSDANKEVRVLENVRSKFHSEKFADGGGIDGGMNNLTMQNVSFAKGGNLKSEFVDLNEPPVGYDLFTYFYSTDEKSGKIVWNIVGAYNDVENGEEVRKWLDNQSKKSGFVTLKDGTKIKISGRGSASESGLASDVKLNKGIIRVWEEFKPKYWNDETSDDENWDDYANGGMTDLTMQNVSFAKGGNVSNEEKLLKELSKVQRDLNSSRLSTYREGDDSQEEKDRIRERESKLARFNEILKVLRESDAKFANGGSLPFMTDPNFGDFQNTGSFANGGLLVNNSTDLEEVAKYMFTSVKKRSWDLRDLIHYFNEDNGFDYRNSVKVWDDMNGYEMRKTYDNILEMLKRIVEANNKKFELGGAFMTDPNFGNFQNTGAFEDGGETDGYTLNNTVEFTTSDDDSYLRGNIGGDMMDLIEVEKIDDNKYSAIAKSYSVAFEGLKGQELEDEVYNQINEMFTTNDDIEVDLESVKIVGKFELGGAFMMTDLAGHTGGSDGLGNPMPLSGVSGTYYTGLVGETGALSSGELFENGGGINMSFGWAKKYLEDNNLYKKLGWYLMMGNGKEKTIKNQDYVIFEDGSALKYDKNQSDWIGYNFPLKKENGGAMAQNQQVINDASQSYVNYYLGEGASQGIYKDGGSIDNQYEGRTPEDVWNNWDLSQKLHFLSDHTEEVYGKASVKGQTNNEINEFFGKLIYEKYDDLPLNTKVALVMHTTRGQYAKGGALKDIDDNLYVSISKTEDDYWFITSKPTTKKQAEEMANLVTPMRGEVNDVKTVGQVKAHSKVIYENGGAFAPNVSNGTQFMSGVYADGGSMSEDISECKKLVSAFCKEFGDKFGLNEEAILEKVKFRDYLGNGASVFVSLSVTSNVEDLKVGETRPTGGYIIFTSDINPNGVTGKDDIARTYSIDIEIKGVKRYTQRRTEEGRYFKSYNYGRTIEEAMDKTDTKIIYDLYSLEKKDDLKFKMSSLFADGGAFAPSVSNGTQFMNGVYANGGSVNDSVIDELWNGYASAVLFTETDSDSGEPLDSEYSVSDFDKETVTSTKKMLADYYSENKDAIEESGLDLDTIGNDIWYTRSGQGAGFFDHSLDEEVEEKLTKGAEALGEYPSVETYDGKISVRGGKVFAKGGFVGTVEFNVGDTVWQKDEKRYATVMNNYGDPINGDYGDIRLDTTGNTGIYSFDPKRKTPATIETQTGYNLIKVGEKGDTGKFTPEVLEDMKASANRLIESRRQGKDKEGVAYYQEVYKRLLDGEFDSMTGAKATASNKKSSVDYTYVPNKDVKELSVVVKGELKKLMGSDILDGVYVKNSAKSTAKSTAKVDANAVFAKMLKDAKEAKRGKSKRFDASDLKKLNLEMVQKLVEAGYTEQQIRNVIFGYTFDNQVLAEGEFDTQSGIFGYEDTYVKSKIEGLVEAQKNKEFAVGIEYPDFDWQGIIKKYKISSKPKDITEKQKGTSGSTENYYEVFVGENIVIGHNYGYKWLDADGKVLSNYMEEDKKVSDPTKQNAWQKERGQKAGFNGGYWYVVSSKIEIIDDVLKNLLAQKGGYCKELEFYDDSLPKALKENKIEFELGGDFAPNVSDGTQFMSGVYANGGVLNKDNVKVGDVLMSTTGVKVKVTEFDPLFGGRVKAIRLDKYGTGKPSQFMSLSKFTNKVEVKKTKKELREEFLEDLSSQVAEVWDKIGADSGGSIRTDDKLLKGYAEGTEEVMQKNDVKKGSFNQSDYDYYLDGNDHLLNDFLVFNGYYNSQVTKAETDWRMKQFDEAMKQYGKSQYVANPNIVKVSAKSSSSSKPKKYIDHDDIESVTLNVNTNFITFAGKDFLNGANLMEKGGDLSKIATYFPIRDIVKVTLKNGETIKPLNGYWLKKGSEPMGKIKTTTPPKNTTSKAGKVTSPNYPDVNFNHKVVINGKTINLALAKSYVTGLNGSRQYDFIDVDGNPMTGYGFSVKEALKQVEDYGNNPIYYTKNTPPKIDETKAHFKMDVSGGKFEVFVDSNFVNQSQGNLPNTELKHYGYGDFYLQTPDGNIDFIRTSEEKEGFVGRTHKMKGSDELVLKLVNAMKEKGRFESTQTFADGGFMNNVYKFGGNIKDLPKNWQYKVEQSGNKPNDNYFSEVLYNGETLFLELGEMGNTREDAEKEVKDFFATVKPLSIEEMEHTWGRNYYVHFKTKRGLGKKLVYTKSEAKDLFDALKDLSGQKNLIGLAKFSIRKYDYSDSGRFYVVDENDNAINKKTGKVYGGKQTLEYVFQNKNDAQHFADKLNEEYKKEDFDYYSFFYDHNSKQVKIEQGFVKDAILNGSKRECEIAKKSYPKLKYKIGDTLETKNNGKATVVNLKMEIWANKEGYVSEYFVVYENYFRTNAGEKYKVTGVERIGTDDVYESSKNNQFADGGQMEVNDINSELEDFDLDELDPFETMQFNHHIKSSGKVGALQVLINSVEGDYSQLSPALAELAEMQMSSEEYDEAGKQMRFERDGYANGGMTGLEYKNSPQYKELKDKRNRLYAQLKSRVVRAVGLDSAMEFYDADLKIAPYRFLERAVTGNFISLDEVNQRLIDSAMEEAEEIDNDDDLEEIGSSDFTYYLKSVLDGAGFKVGFVGSTLKRLNEDGSIKQINNGFFEDGGFMNGVYAKGGELQGKFLAEIGVPYNFEYVVEDEYEFSRFLSKALTNKFNFGNGAWGIKIVKPLFEKNYGQKIVVEIEIPVGVTQSEGLSKFDVLEFMSKTLTKKWFGNGVWNVDVVNSYANGGSMNSSGEITINKRNFDVIVMPKKLEIEVQITRADTVDQYGLNDAEVEWHQERWGYVIKADDNKKFNKALRVLGITQKFADGGFMADVYANGGGVGKENIRIVNTSRVTGGMNPTIRFNFSDGTVLKTKSDGYGVEYEKEVYQDLISKWFDSDDDYELGGVEDAKYADGAMLDDNEGFMKADNENNYRYPEMEVYVETIDEPIDLTNKVSRISGKVDTLDEPIDLRSNVSRRTNDVVIRTLDESADLNDDKRVRARMSYNPKDRNPDKLLSVNPRAFEFIKDLPTPTSNTHKND